MSDQSGRAPIATKRVVCELPNEGMVRVVRDVAYGGVSDDRRMLDVYLPPDHEIDRPRPAVIFAIGFADVGMRKMVGCCAKDMEVYVSWARLVAASGLVALTYTNSDPTADLVDVLRYVHEHAASFGIIADRIGVWACSGNVPNALSLLMRESEHRPRCAVLCYGYMLDLAGETYVADAAKTIGFATPCTGRSIADLAPDLPLFITRAGRDAFPHVNDSIDRFVAAALAANLALTLVNHAEGPHAFDILDDSETTRDIVRQVLRFFQVQLAVIG